MRLAIVGSVVLAGNADAQRLIEDAIARWKPTVVVSGGADGIDTMAVETAKRLGIDTCEHLPENGRWAPNGYKARNLIIAQDCDVLVRIVAFASKTYGSGWTRDQVARLGKPTEEFIVHS